MVKICGITRSEDARFAVEVGADVVGIVFYPGSPRYVKTSDAVNIVAAAHDAGGKVAGVFVNEKPRDVDYMCRKLKLDLVQLHGHESPVDYKNLGVPIIKAIHVKEALPIDRIEEWTGKAFLFLFEGASSTYGGAGASFDFTMLSSLRLSTPFLIAGGLTPANVGDVVRAVRPYGVDVSSGVESGNPGVKDHEKIKSFILHARGALD